jgi:flagellar FliJ protein
MGKTFLFPLEKVLDYRKKIENQKTEALSQSRKKKKELEKNLENIEDKKQLIINGNHEKLTVNQLSISTDYLNQINKEIEGEEHQINVAEKEIENRLGKLKSASKDKKAVEKLKERKFDEHKKNIKRYDRKKTDEIANRKSQKIGLDES